MSLLVHHAILDAASRGYLHFNFGGTWKTQDSVYRFKSRWGAIDLPYYYHINAYRGHETLTALNPKVLRRLFPGFYLFPAS